MSRVWRVFHPAPDGEGDTIALDPEESHHVRQVLRLRPGDRLAVFDGRGREYEAVLVDSTRQAVRVRVGAPLRDRVEPPLRVVLYPSLCRPDRMEWLIQKGTEVGVAAFRPLRAERSESPRVSPGRLDRWRRIAREACKQCGRRVIPGVEEPLSAPPPAAEAVAALMLDVAGSAVPLAGALGSVASAGPPAEVWLAVGPEGGFEPAERAAMEAAGWIGVSLGPRVLRAETAGICAAAIVLHRLGDLGSRPAGPI